MDFTPVEVSRYYTARVPDHSKHRQVAGQWRAKCPVHGGKDPNFSINPENGMAFCHSQCGRGFDLISLEMELSGLSFGKSKETVFELIGRPKPSPADRDIDQIFAYTDAAGNPAYRVVRKYDDRKKEFKQHAADGKGGWLPSLNGTKPLPYRLPEVASAQLVFIAEGEKCVEALRYLKLTGSCNSGGADHFQPELAEYYAGKDLGVLPDNDDPGRRHALKVARILKPLAKSVRIVEIPGLPEKGDIADFVAAGRTVGELMALYNAAPAWTPEFEFREPHENDKYLRSLPSRIAEVGGFRNWLGELAKTGLPTPYQKITRALTGMRNGEFYVLAANQGSGKTSMALQFVINLLLQGRLLRAAPAIERNSVLLPVRERRGRSQIERRGAFTTTGADIIQRTRLAQEQPKRWCTSAAPVGAGKDSGAYDCRNYRNRCVYGPGAHLRNRLGHDASRRKINREEGIDWVEDRRVGPWWRLIISAATGRTSPSVRQ